MNKIVCVCVMSKSSCIILENFLSYEVRLIFHLIIPFYLSQGFKVLVQREWLDFGHKFADRCGVQPVSKNVNERSPIFIQFLDCVYQIVKQCPDYFEFNCTYLVSTLLA